MKIDKLNGNIAFSEETHQYWNVNDNEKYISVTTLIHKFTQPFDSDFWSSYKALEKLIPKENWAIEKKSLLNTKKINSNILEIYNIDSEIFNTIKQDILDEWQKKNLESCERGTKIHAELENSFYGSNTRSNTLKKLGIGGKFECKKNYNKLDLEYGVYPEYLISRTSKDGILRLAGQIDLIIKEGNNIIVADWKSNAKIDMKSGYNSATKSNAKMLYPLNTLMDCNFIHYTLQLSTYAWMLQKLNPNFIIKDLILYHFDHNGKETLYHCDYLKHEVERMLTFYKKTLIQERQRAKLQRIEY